MTSTIPLPRYHAMDALRASMMLLGVALHAAVAYVRTPVGDLWGFTDPRTHPAFDLLVAFIHAFRMPVFFVMAGFFAAFLYGQRGPRQMVGNRLRRVLVPLVVGWWVLFPATIAGFAFAQMGGTREAVMPAIRFAASPAALEHLQLLHLWFLLDLLLYYAVALVACRLAAVLPASRQEALDAGFGALLERWYAVPVLALVTVLTLAPMPSGMLETPGTFARPPATLAAHGVFFAFGWLLYRRRDALPRFTRHAWRMVAAGCAVFAVHVAALTTLAGQRHPIVHGVAIGTLAVAIWLFVFGLVGLFLRYAERPRPLARYAADASYWFYLVHLPLVAWGSGLLGGLPWPAGAKYLVLLTAVVVICWLTYDVAVRPTAIGALLNGRRYPRGLPGVPAAAGNGAAAERATDQPVPRAGTLTGSASHAGP